MATLSLGATISTDGMAIRYSIAIVFMAESEGIGHLIGTVEMFMIVLVPTIGVGPVPSGGIVMITTIWSSVFLDMALPSTFVLIVAVNWFLDRCRTTVNITGDGGPCGHQPGAQGQRGDGESQGKSHV